MEKNNKKELNKIISKINRKELDDFLVDLLNSNEKFYDMFRLRFRNLFSNLTIDEYKSKIYNVIATSGGRDGFIDYEEAWDYTHGMYEITHEVEELVKDGYYDLAFDVLSCILDTIPNTEIDDSYGSTSDVANVCIEIIENILDLIKDKNEKLLNKILNYVLNELNFENLSNYGIELYELLEFYLDNNIYTEKIDKALVSILISSKDKKYFWKTNRYVNYLIDIYTKENKEEKILGLLEEYSYDKKVCFQLVDVYLEQKEVNKAIELLKERLDDERNACDYALKLSQIYYDEKMTSEYKDILYKLLFEFNKYDIEVYKKIKKLYSNKEWIIERQNIIDKVLKEEKDYNYFNSLLNIYIEEGMIDEIFNTIRDENIETILSYEEYVLPKYNKELIDIYTNICKKFAKRANNRKLYRELASYIRHVKNMKDSKCEYQEMMLEISEEFRNKPAMQDELKGLY